MKPKLAIRLLAALLPLTVHGTTLAETAMEVWKSPTCGCCGKWVDYVKEAGYRVKVHEMPDTQPVKDRYGIARQLQGCHTAVIEGYVVEGHVPVSAIQKLLKGKPDIRGIAVPGMPPNSPGMGPHTPGSLPVYTIPKEGGEPELFAVE